MDKKADLDWKMIKDTTLLGLLAGGAVGSIAAVSHNINRSEKDDKEKMDRTRTTHKNIVVGDTLKKIEEIRSRSKQAQDRKTNDSDLGVWDEGKSFALASLGLFGGFTLGTKLLSDIGRNIRMSKLKDNRDKAKKRYEDLLMAKAVGDKTAMENHEPTRVKSASDDQRLPDDTSFWGKIIGTPMLLWLLGTGLVSAGTYNVAKGIEDRKKRELEGKEYSAPPRVTLKSAGEEINHTDARTMVALNLLSRSRLEGVIDHNGYLDNEEVSRSIKKAGYRVEDVLRRADEGRLGMFVKSSAWKELSKPFDKPYMSFEEYIKAIGV